MENETHKINILPKIVVDKIAAGEVIERPASVVKELVENALDASATKIDVYLEESGKKLIKVTDNGCGMSREDLPRSIHSHATSKLQNVEDVHSIKTLGFRGEALPSIGAISMLRIISRSEESIVGAEIEVDGGKTDEIKEKGCSVGTQVEIRDLFFNTPVRRKFLKSNPIEMSHISEMITRIALANPKIHFNLIHNGKTVFNLPNVSSFRERIATFFGNDIGKNLVTLNSMQPQLGIKGYALPPSYDCRTTKMQYVFINGRYIRDKSIYHAITESYRGMMMSGRKPIVFLFLQMNPSEFDVNVHPTKIEVRFKNASQMYGQLVSCIRNNIRQLELGVSVDMDNMDNAAAAPAAPGAGQRPSPNMPSGMFANREREIESERLKRSLESKFNNQLNFPDNSRPVETTPAPSTVERASCAPQRHEYGETTNRRRIQIQDSYIVEEKPDGINIIDQHALHEIILYEEIKQNSKGAKLVSQQLLIPEPVELAPGEFFVIINLKDKLERLGFDIEEFGQNTIIVRSFPQILKDVDCKEFIKELLSEVDESICKENVDDCLDKLAKIAACRGAVKMGQRLKDQEVDALLEKRDKMGFTNNCPHGRPTNILMPFVELEKQFKRR